MVYGFLEAVLLLGAKNNGGGGVSITMQNILNEKNQKAIKHNVPEQKVKGERTK